MILSLLCNPCHIFQADWMFPTFLIGRLRAGWPPFGQAGVGREGWGLG
jgi:hypothetical protein